MLSSYFLRLYFLIASWTFYYVYILTKILQQRLEILQIFILYFLIYVLQWSKLYLVQSVIIVVKKSSTLEKYSYGNHISLFTTFSYYFFKSRWRHQYHIISAFSLVHWDAFLMCSCFSFFLLHIIYICRCCLRYILASKKFPNPWSFEFWLIM